MQILVIKPTYKQKDTSFIGVLEIWENDLFLYTQSTKFKQSTKEAALQDAIDLKGAWVNFDLQNRLQ